MVHRRERGGEAFLAVALTAPDVGELWDWSLALTVYEPAAGPR